MFHQPIGLDTSVLPLRLSSYISDLFCPPRYPCDLCCLVIGTLITVLPSSHRSRNASDLVCPTRYPCALPSYQSRYTNDLFCHISPVPETPVTHFVLPCHRPSHTSVLLCCIAAAVHATVLPVNQDSKVNVGCQQLNSNMKAVSTQPKGILELFL